MTSKKRLRRNLIFKKYDQWVGINVVQLSRVEKFEIITIKNLLFDFSKL